MQDLGAVFYVKTNVPVGMMGCETINNVWGEATNPWGFTPGGSSGGEGALVSMKGSPLGIGTDLGGSVRLPAGWCGLYGFKASALRMSMRGHRSPLEGVDLIKGTCGPLARCFDTVEFWLELITSEPRLWELDNDVSYARPGIDCFFGKLTVSRSCQCHGALRTTATRIGS